MSVSISWNRTDSALVGSVRGRIDTNNASIFDGLIKSWSRPDEPSLILDFSGVSFISSAGLHRLLLLAREYELSGRQFGLCELPDPIQELMEISGLFRIIQIFDSYDAAIGKPSQPSGGKDTADDRGGSSESFNIKLIHDKFSDIAEYIIQKHEHVTGTSIPSEKLKQAHAEITAGLRDVDADMEVMLRDYRMKLFHIAEAKLNKVLDE
ncbi:MAG: STAS domain-containing protein [Bacteroidetes bacterium]|nr:STAS domain-containing protein [Bacteroidota bacterium]MDE2673059.1 STAS domain-containing protein [Bacteroidota bacterium]